jgi:hypothetical protein
MDLAEQGYLLDYCRESYPLEWRPQADLQQRGTRTGKSVLKGKSVLPVNRGLSRIHVEACTNQQ